MFVNTLAMRNYPAAGKTYESFLKEVVVNSVKAFENQDLQFEDLVDKLELERDPSRNPLFDICMVVQNFRQTEQGLLTGTEQNNRENAGIQAKEPQAQSQTQTRIKHQEEKRSYEGYTRNKAKFDMTFFVSERDENVYITIEYYTAIFKRDTIRGLVEHFKKLIKQVISNPHIKLEDIDILTKPEKQKLLYEFNRTGTDYPKESTLSELFETHVENTPNHIAVVFGNEHLTYKALDEQSSRMAHYLYDNGVVPNQPVGMLMDRCISMIIAIMGILKVGGAYVPISPSFPLERSERMINDAGIRILIGQKKYIKTLNRLQWECMEPDTFLCIDSEKVQEEDEREESKLMSRKLWEYVGETAVDEVTGGGWNSSYTGNPIPQKEMDEYGDNILQKLQPLLHPQMRVLEIGCASGISMYRIAPQVGLYYGTDLSETIIQENKLRIKAEGHKNIKLARLAAHEIHQLEEKDFDLVIINSVIQCFHGHNYLRKVIRGIIDLMSDESNSYLFIGDIMDQDLKKDLMADLVKFRQDNQGKDYKTKIDWSEELFISRPFLQDLAADYPGIRDITFSDKIYTIKNELTQFRYDALLHIDKKEIKTKRIKQKHKHQHDLRILRKYSKEKANPGVGPGNLAYIIYTSGSTGIPKGTLTTHYNVSRVVKNTNYIDFQPGDRILQLSDYAFDGSTFDIYGALLNGLPLVIVSQEHLLEIETLCSLIKRERITVFFVTTALFNTLVDVGLSSLSHIRKVLFGGERVSEKHAAKALEYLGQDKILHVYGPTETTVYATYYQINQIKNNQITIPIGSPISNTVIYIMDLNLKPVPIGISGEIYIGGPGVCNGYLNNQALTKEKFLTDPFKPGEIMYKTGDLGRWLQNGTIEFIGRIDLQVKVRGFRIELGEIQGRLLSYYAVRECIVIAREDEKGSRYLCAYWVGNETIETTELQNYLARGLPDFMIPSYFVQMERLPLTSSHKVDKSKLPDPTLVLEGDYTAPRDEVEEKLLEIWSGVLGVRKESIGIDANFFELGGHSLKATMLTAKVHKELKVKVPMAEVFKRQNIREFSQFIRNSSHHRYSSIEKAEKKEYYPPSAAQKRIYILQEMDLENTHYNMPYMIPLEQDIHKQQLENIFESLTRRHESFRTDFHILDGQLVQVVRDNVEFEIEYYCAENKEEHRAPRAMRHASTIRDFTRPFDLSRAPLLRMGFVPADKENEPNVLMVDMHHIISDGTSREILQRDFAALSQGKNPAPLKFQYKDYSQWQNSREQQKILNSQQKYWLKEFSGEIPVLDLPTDYPRPLMQSFEGNRLQFYIDEETTRTLKEFSQKTGATLYMILLSVFNILLSKLSGQEDIVVGTPIAGRRHADLQDIVGMFVNTLAMRNYPAGDKHFQTFLKELKERTLEVYENQEYQFEDLVDKVTVNRDTSRNPVFDIMFNFLNIADSRETVNIQNVDFDAIEDRGEFKANFDITFQGSEMGDAIYFTVDYCTKLYENSTITSFVNYFKGILLEITRDPAKRLSAIELISEDQRRQLLVDFNDTQAEYPANKSISQLFTEQVEQTPDHTAVVGNNVVLTYRELNEISNRLAYRLKEKGVEPDTIVGIMVVRSLEMIIGILGILKAGGAYLPIDPDYPEERKQYILKDSGAKILLTLQEIAGLSSSHRHLSPAPVTYLAYVIYTSGSTGRPKGVLVETLSVINILSALQEDYPLETSDTYLLKTSYVFDVSVTELFGWFLGGGRLAVLAKGGEKDPQQILDTIERHSISHVNFVPSMFNLFLEILEPENIKKLSRLKYIFLAGEALLPVAVKRFNRLKVKAVLENIYGPTEGTIYASSYPLWQWDGTGDIPIGKPVRNVKCYILNKYHHLQPVRVAGELCIAGAGLARGYLNRPELTTEKFHPVSLGYYRSYMSYIYRTGDLARWLPDGNIEFIGRIDEQVKIRGYRIELGEIESILLNREEISEVIVTVRVDKQGDKYLCAYIVPCMELTPAVLREFLSEKLPAYMIPSYFVQLEAIPLTPSGKVDRKALPAPGLKTGENYAAPRDEIEERLTEMWSEVLNIPSIGIDDNFFELGGHSLKATILIAKIHQRFKVKIKLLGLFANPTIKGIARYIKRESAAGDDTIMPTEEKEYYPLSSAQKRLYVVQQIEAHTVSYNIFYAVELEGELDKEKFEKTFRQLIRRQESFRTSFITVEKDPVQRINETVTFEIETHNPQLAKSTIKKFIRPFDLSKAPLLRVALITLTRERHILMVDINHIISDGTSIGIFIKEFVALYGGEPLSPLDLQYKDYTQWQYSNQYRESIKSQEDYWMNQYRGEIQRFNLPLDYPRPSIQSFEGDEVQFEIDSEIASQLHQLALAEEATLYMILLALYSILLSKLSRREDIIIGTPAAGRKYDALQPIIGMFANTLAMRNFPAKTKTFKEFLTEVRERTLQAIENQDYPFEELVDRVAADRDSGRNPLFDVMFAFQNQDIPEAEIPGLKLKPFPHHTHTSPFELILNAEEKNGTILFKLWFCSVLFKKEKIKRFVDYLNEIIFQVVENPGIKLESIKISHDLIQKRVTIPEKVREGFNF
jgi:fengycin family lipopeptide synthetase D